MKAIGLFGKILFGVLAINACSFPHETASQNDAEPNLLMEQVEYIRMADGSPEFRVTAEAVRRFEEQRIMEMDDFTFEQFLAEDEAAAEPEIDAWGNADRVRVETDTNNFSMSGSVLLTVTTEDMVIETETLAWRDSERALTAPGEVLITRSDGTTLAGTGFAADARRRSWIFESAIEGIVVEETEEDAEEE